VPWSICPFCFLPFVFLLAEQAGLFTGELVVGQGALVVQLAQQFELRQGVRAEFLVFPAWAFPFPCNWD
jgi:hypothetical protein